MSRSASRRAARLAVRLASRPPVRRGSALAGLAGFAATVCLALGPGPAATAHPWGHRFDPEPETGPDDDAAAAEAELAGGPQAMVPEGFPLSPAVRDVLDAAWLTDDERADLAQFHGVLPASERTTPLRQARHAIATWDAAADPAATPGLTAIEVAAWHLARGETALVFAALDAEADPSIAGRRLRAEALAGIGRVEEALAELDRLAPVVRAAMAREEPAELTELARARVLEARLRGADARGYGRIIALLSQVHQTIDQLYWPALLVEAELLADKHSVRDAVAAYHAALRLNPRSREAWYGLGRLALARFDFEGARRAAAAIERGAPDHPHARLLEAEIRLYQNDPEGAIDLLDGVLAENPALRRALALRAAAAGLTYDAEALAAALDAADAIAPGTPEPLYAAGRFLSMFRQYDRAADLLDRAIERQPNWSRPRMTLGLMELQAGRDDRAIAVLRSAARIDPFNKQLANSLALIEELQDYATIETEHFIVRYRPGEDEVLASMMAEPLEAMHAEVAGRFGGGPDRKTIVELMPDHQRFAVRITGMPRLFTIAACTGPVIAMEVPRDGPRSRHQGPFDWLRVMRHEYTHTVTLALTSNRIPHWLTEGAAVDMESAPRTWGDCLMLTSAHRAGALFTLDEIKWGFVRPRTPRDRALAYAQSQWMLEFMTERWGAEAVAKLLRQYDEGVREAEAIPASFGVERDVLYARFLEWAEDQIASWGLAPEPSLRTILAARGARVLDEIPVDAGPGSTIDNVEVDGEQDAGGPGGGGIDPEGATRADVQPTQPVLDDALLTELVAEFPDHPDLLKFDLERRVAAGEPVAAAMQERLLRYAAIRPLDPFPHGVLARVLLDGDDPAAAVPHLEFLDAREQRTSAYARKLAELYRSAGRREPAVRAAERAVGFDPYDAPNRELAATVRIEAGQLAEARGHLFALSLLEPDRPLHQRRLEAIDAMIGASATVPGG